MRLVASKNERAERPFRHRFLSVIAAVRCSLNIEISTRNLFPRDGPRKVEGRVSLSLSLSLDVKSYLHVPPSLHVNSMHLFGDAELEQGLRPQAKVGALAV